MAGTGVLKSIGCDRIAVGIGGRNSNDAATVVSPALKVTFEAVTTGARSSVIVRDAVVVPPFPSLTV